MKLLIGEYAHENSYIGSYTSNGEIQGTIPQYIYNSTTNKFTEVTELAGTFYRDTNIKIAPKIPKTVKGMGATFKGCTNLEKASEIPENVGDYEDYYVAIKAFKETFASCTTLKQAPKISSKKIKMMYGTFKECSNLENVPNLPDRLESMYETFMNCSNLENVPPLPDELQEMWMTFYGCTSLKTFEKIPSNVNKIFGTFIGCRELTGTIVIENADNINSYDNCFAATTKEITLQGNGLLEKFNSIAATGSAGNVKVDEANIIQPPQ